MAAHAGRTPDRRPFGTTTDDSAIFIEDTMDRSTVQCITDSPSAAAILTPQHYKPPLHHVDVCDYDASSLGRLSGGSASKAAPAASPGNSSTGSSLPRDGRASVRLNFGKSPTPKAPRYSGGSHPADSGACSLARSTPSRRRPSRGLAGAAGAAASGAPASPSVAAEEVVPLAEYERLERERNRYQKMYEHQRALYEDMAAAQETTYAALQEKIMEVVALSTRNEESKRFIRQLKRETAESRTRVMDLQNQALAEARRERSAKEHYDALIAEYELKYERVMERSETRTAGVESLMRDIAAMQRDGERVHVGQLDGLLRAAYAKSTALFSDLLRQGRQIDLLYDSKAELERQIDGLRRDKREAEAALAEERRRMMFDTERFVEQIEEQQQSILNLRQMLIRTMESAAADYDGYDDAQAQADEQHYRRYRYGSVGERHPQGDEEEEEISDEDGEEGSDSTASSRSSEEDEDENEEDEEEVEERAVLEDDDRRAGGDENFVVWPSRKRRAEAKRSVRRLRAVDPNESGDYTLAKVCDDDLNDSEDCGGGSEREYDEEPAESAAPKRTTGALTTHPVLSTAAGRARGKILPASYASPRERLSLSDEDDSGAAHPREDGAGCEPQHQRRQQRAGGPLRTLHVSPSAAAPAAPRDDTAITGPQCKLRNRCSNSIAEAKLAAPLTSGQGRARLVLSPKDDDDDATEAEDDVAGEDGGVAGGLPQPPDFSAALAAVNAKRQRDREAREQRRQQRAAPTVTLGGGDKENTPTKSLAALLASGRAAGCGGDGKKPLRAEAQDPPRLSVGSPASTLAAARKAGSASAFPSPAAAPSGPTAKKPSIGKLTVCAAGKR